MQILTQQVWAGAWDSAFLSNKLPAGADAAVGGPRSEQPVLSRDHHQIEDVGGRMEGGERRAKRTAMSIMNNTYAEVIMIISNIYGALTMCGAQHQALYIY